MSGLSSKDLLAGWLGYLQEQAAGALVGHKAKDNILKASETWSLLQNEEFYCLECPLLGEAGVDFALQYSTDGFLNGKTFAGKLGEKYNRFLSLYSQKMGFGQHFYLEIDTGFGDSDKLAIFLELPENNKSEIINLALRFMGKAGLEKAINLLRHRAKNLDMVMLGSMLSRLQAPVRICLGPKEHILNKPGRLAEMINFLEGVANTENIIADIREIEKIDFLDCFLDIDILPNGNIGSSIGLELMCCVHSLEQQHLMLDSLQYHDFKSFLKKYQLTDERIGCLKRCCFYAPLPKSDLQDEERLYSMVSHFKLSYKSGIRQPAKVYLQGDRGK